MKKIIALVILVLCLPQLSIAQEIDFLRLENYLKTEMSANQIPGLAVGVIKEGKIVFCKGFGKSGRKASPVTAESPFLLASLTKSFTGMAISQLENQGKLSQRTILRGVCSPTNPGPSRYVIHLF